MLPFTVNHLGLSPKVGDLLLDFLCASLGMVGFVFFQRGFFNLQLQTAIIQPIETNRHTLQLHLQRAGRFIQQIDRFVR